MRSPTEIAIEARTLIDTSSRAFVPPSLIRIGELSVEFMESTAAALEEARRAAADEFLELGQAVAHLQTAVAPTA